MKNGRLGVPVAVAVPILPIGSLVSAKQEFTAVPADGSRKRVRIAAGTTGIVEDGIVKSNIVNEPDLRFISFEQARGVVCVSADPRLVSIA